MEARIKLRSDLAKLAEELMGYGTRPTKDDMFECAHRFEPYVGIMDSMWLRPVDGLVTKVLHGNRHEAAAAETVLPYLLRTLSAESCSLVPEGRTGYVQGDNSGHPWFQLQRKLDVVMALNDVLVEVDIVTFVLPAVIAYCVTINEPCMAAVQLFEEFPELKTPTVQHLAGCGRFAIFYGIVMEALEDKPDRDAVVLRLLQEAPDDLRDQGALVECLRQQLKVQKWSPEDIDHVIADVQDKFSPCEEAVAEFTRQLEGVTIEGETFLEDVQIVMRAQDAQHDDWSSCLGITGVAQIALYLAAVAPARQKLAMNMTDFNMFFTEGNRSGFEPRSAFGRVLAKTAGAVYWAQQAFIREALFHGPQVLVNEYKEPVEALMNVANIVCTEVSLLPRHASDVWGKRAELRAEIKKVAVSKVAAGMVDVQREVHQISEAQQEQSARMGAFEQVSMDIRTQMRLTAEATADVKMLFRDVQMQLAHMSRRMCLPIGGDKESLRLRWTGAANVNTSEQGSVGQKRHHQSLGRGTGYAASPAGHVTKCLRPEPNEASAFAPGSSAPPNKGDSGRGSAIAGGHGSSTISGSDDEGDVFIRPPAAVMEKLMDTLGKHKIDYIVAKGTPSKVRAAAVLHNGPPRRKLRPAHHPSEGASTDRDAQPSQPLQPSLPSRPSQPPQRPQPPQRTLPALPSQDPLRLQVSQPQPETPSSNGPLRPPRPTLAEQDAAALAGGFAGLSMGTASMPGLSEEDGAAGVGATQGGPFTPPLPEEGRVIDATPGRSAVSQSQAASGTSGAGEAAAGKPAAQPAVAGLAKAARSRIPRLALPASGEPKQGQRVPEQAPSATTPGGTKAAPRGPNSAKR